MFENDVDPRRSNGGSEDCSGHDMLANVVIRRLRGPKIRMARWPKTKVDNE